MSEAYLFPRWREDRPVFVVRYQKGDGYTRHSPNRSSVRIFDMFRKLYFGWTATKTASAMGSKSIDRMMQVRWILGPYPWLDLALLEPTVEPVKWPKRRKPPINQRPVSSSSITPRQRILGRS